MVVIISGNTEWIRLHGAQPHVWASVPGWNWTPVRCTPKCNGPHRLEINRNTKRGRN